MTVKIYTQYKIFLAVICLLGFSFLTVNANQKNNILKQAQLLSQEIDIKLLMDDVAWMADDARMGRASGTPAEDEVGQWLATRYEQLGLTQFTQLGIANFTHDFEFHVYDQYGNEHPAFGENILGIIQGSQQPDEYLIVSAHYDHLGVEDGQIYNGADDDASGVAAVLEVARVIKKFGWQPKKTLVFAAFSAEEIGRYGSRNFCHAIHRKNIFQQMMGFNFEMLGATKGAPMFVHVWEQQTPATQPILHAVKTASDMLDVDMRTTADIDPGSDALELLECGVTATTMDVSGGEEFEYHHPYYHSPEDKPEHIDQENFFQAVQVAAMSVWLLANEVN